MKPHKILLYKRDIFTKYFFQALKNAGRNELFQVGAKFEISSPGGTVPSAAACSLRASLFQLWIAGTAIAEPLPTFFFQSVFTQPNDNPYGRGR